MSNVTAKVKLTGKTPFPSTGDNDQPGEVDQYGLSFSADYEDGRNKEWAKYTPALSVSMTVKASVADLFKVGTSYTLTFSED